MPWLLATALAAAISTPKEIPVRPVSDVALLPLEIGQGRPAVLHFWATWCDACREEFPRLRKLLNALPGRGVAVLLVSIDRPEKLDEVKRQLRHYGVEKLPAVVLDAPEPDPVATAIGEPSWDGTLPSTFVFDAKGRLRKSFLGTTAPASLARAVRGVR
jgi:thiol-disulfide isomerase/thioredoxin